MTTSYGALCNDFYINQKLSLKMDLPSERETVLHLFDRIRRAAPDMDRFRRYEDEFALESSRKEGEYRWIALRRTSLRTGCVNPASMEQAMSLHRLVLEQAPYHLTISPLDVDYVELLFGFDLECAANHDEVVFEALIADSPVGELLRPSELGSSLMRQEPAEAMEEDDDEDQPGQPRIIDVQPVFGMQLNEQGDQAYFEVKTRQRSRRGAVGRFRDEPISLFLTLRKYGPVGHVNEMPVILDALREQGEVLLAERLVPSLLTPIARQIARTST